MNCLDCDQPAVGICTDCGAAICRDHVRVGTEGNTSLAPIGPAQPPVAATRPALRLRCFACDAPA